MKCVVNFASGQQSQTELRLYFGVCVLQKFQQSGHRNGRFAVVGGRADNLNAVYEQGIDLVLPICRKPMPLDQALNPQEATTNLIFAGESAAQAYDLARL